MHHHRQSPNVHSVPITTGVSKAGKALLGILLVAQLMVILDITAVNIALPSLAKDL